MSDLAERLLAGIGSYTDGGIVAIRAGLLREAALAIAELEKRVEELEAFVKCPIGLDACPDICSAGTCRVCLSQLRQDLTAERQRREACEAALRPFAEAGNAEMLQPSDNPIRERNRVDGLIWSHSDPRNSAEYRITVPHLRAATAYFARYPSESDNRTKVAE